MFNLGFYSGKGLPEVRWQPTLLDRLLELAAMLHWVLLWVFAIYAAIHLPSGEVESSGIAVAIVGTVIMPLLAYGAYSPVRRINFSVRVTERTVYVQYMLASRFFRILNVIIGFLLLSITLADCGPLLGLPSELFHILTDVAAGLMGLAFIIYWVLAYKNK